MNQKTKLIIFGIGGFLFFLVAVFVVAIVQYEPEQPMPTGGFLPPNIIIPAQPIENSFQDHGKYKLPDINPSQPIEDTQKLPPNSSTSSSTPKTSQAPINLLPGQIDNPTQKACVDSDGGQDYFTKGLVKGVNRGIETLPGGKWKHVDAGEATAIDRCYQGSYDIAVYGDKPAVAENSCGSDGRITVQEYLCPNGCSDGACKK